MDSLIFMSFFLFSLLVDLSIMHFLFSSVFSCTCHSVYFYNIKCVDLSARYCLNEMCYMVLYSLVYGMRYIPSPELFSTSVIISRGFWGRCLEDFSSSLTIHFSIVDISNSIGRDYIEVRANVDVVVDLLR